MPLFYIRFKYVNTASCNTLLRLVQNVQQTHTPIITTPLTLRIRCTNYKHQDLIILIQTSEYHTSHSIASPRL